MTMPVGEVYLSNCLLRASTSVLYAATRNQIVAVSQRTNLKYKKRLLSRVISCKRSKSLKLSLLLS